ncbi:hypothetical protein FXF51_01850 [Nonomuraea sp. PA05]|uniref:hypothetical protein n=1 Tax=Nonomuraea sp. PA05 TaxID=2604466 RepID=UPI0011D8C4DD|nr:hypothetical protein [Nonomuraea sp. PA05]TYB71204.1 hypothetical protein FXF51_01850 [Nonomuraea sp. PA05]
MSTDWARVADMLDTVANLLDGGPGLSPDGAVRIALAGHPNAQIPDDYSEVSRFYDEVTMALVCDHADLYLGRESDPLPADEINAEEGARAARAAAVRLRSYLH